MKSDDFADFPIVRFTVVAMLGLIIMGAFQFSNGSHGVTESGVVMNLPDQIEEFFWKDQPASEGEKFILPKETHLWMQRLGLGWSHRMVSESKLLIGRYLK